METSRAVGAINSCTPPQEYVMHKQVSRLRFILLGRLPATSVAVAFVSVRPLYGYWGSSEISSAFPWRDCLRQRPFRDADTHAIHFLIVYGEGHAVSTAHAARSVFYLAGCFDPAHSSAEELLIYRGL